MPFKFEACFCTLFNELVLIIKWFVLFPCSPYVMYDIKLFFDYFYYYDREHLSEGCSLILQKTGVQEGRQQLERKELRTRAWKV